MKIDSEKLWYTKNFSSLLLLPLSWLFQIVVFVRRAYYKAIRSNQHLEDVYSIVVGNITVGGSGKTPFVAYLAQKCKQSNFKVGIISRGYKRDDKILIEVLEDSLVEDVGDEALMLKQQTSCPVAVSADRYEAASYLHDKYKLDVIISDDGLQHHKLPRDFEIVIVDGVREFGNGRCLPAGPLREPVSRLASVDLVISNGENPAYECQYISKITKTVSLVDKTTTKNVSSFVGSKVHVLAGIGYPERFFTLLRSTGIEVITHPFQDHHHFTRQDLEFNDDLAILMTEKDAVKCKQFKKENTWYVPMSIVPNTKLENRISNLLEDIN